jgi:hypothetical protein
LPARGLSENNTEEGRARSPELVRRRFSLFAATDPLGFSEDFTDWQIAASRLGYFDRL